MSNVTELTSALKRHVQMSDTELHPDWVTNVQNT